MSDTVILFMDRPADVSNAFQFKPKRRSMDKTGVIIMGFAIFSIIVFLGAVAMMWMIEVPE